VHRKPAGPVRKPQPARVERGLEMKIRPRPISPAGKPAPGKFERDLSGLRPPPNFKPRGSSKFSRFILVEVIALGVLVPSGAVALSRYFSDPTLVLAMNLLTITAAVVAALVPIIFYAVGPAMPAER
jgi:hypothetical protein